MSIPTIIPPNHRVRPLINGKFIAEEKRGWLFPRWVAIDLTHPEFLWNPSDKFYKDCIGTRDECLEAIACRGR